MILTGAMLLSVFSGNWSNMGIPIPLDRVAVACGIATALVRSIQLRRGPRLRPVHWLMLLLVLYAAASAAWSHTLTQHGPEFALVDRLGVDSVLPVPDRPGGVQDAEKTETPDSRHRDLVILGAYLGLMALFERTGAHQPRASPVTSPIRPSACTFGRSRSPFLEAGANGLAMFDYIGRRGDHVAVLAGRTGCGRLVIGVMVLCAGGIVFTLTRQVWIGAAVGTAVAMLSNRTLRRWISRRRR